MYITLISLTIFTVAPHHVDTFASIPATRLATFQGAPVGVSRVLKAVMVVNQVALLLAYLWKIERTQLPPFATANRTTAVVRLNNRTAAKDRTWPAQCERCLGSGHFDNHVII